MLYSNQMIIQGKLSCRVARVKGSMLIYCPLGDQPGKRQQQSSETEAIIM